jgi:acylphosphatase
MNKCINLTIQGKVQGVGFRYSCRQMAVHMGIKGFVQNLPDGRVFIEAEGDETALALFENWCKTGPSRARVENIRKETVSLKEYTRFEIR